jgi:hypothetical protein
MRAMREVEVKLQKIAFDPLPVRGHLAQAARPASAIATAAISP